MSATRIWDRHGFQRSINAIYCPSSFWHSKQLALPDVATTTLGISEVVTRTSSYSSRRCFCPKIPFNLLNIFSVSPYIFKTRRPSNETVVSTTLDHSPECRAGSTTPRSELPILRGHLSSLFSSLNCLAAVSALYFNDYHIHRATPLLILGGTLASQTSTAKIRQGL